jgi:PAS domain S-box-containing protein
MLTLSEALRGVVGVWGLPPSDDFLTGTQMKTEVFALERHVHEKVLSESEDRYRRLLASTSDYIYTVTLEDHRAAATSHSPGCEAVTGYSPDEFRADPSLWYRMVWPEDRPAVLAQVEHLMKGERPPALEHRILHKNGSLRWIRNAPVPHLNVERQVVRYDGVVSDVTARKEAEELLRVRCSELAESEGHLKAALAELKASHAELQATQMQLMQAAKLELIGTMAAGVVHDLKNPLQTMLLGLDYLCRLPGADTEDISLTLNCMRDALKRTEMILREMLQMSAATEFEKKPEDLNGVIDRSLQLVHHQVTVSQINVVTKLAAELPLVPLDKSRMEQVFINLFMNAVDAMPRNGILTVTSRAVPLDQSTHSQDPLFGKFRRGTTVVVTEVQDTGAGIAEEHLARIFESFFTTKPTGAGTGLGLWMVKRIVDLHNGAIEIRNAPQRGALVRLVLAPEQS